MVSELFITRFLRSAPLVRMEYSSAAIFVIMQTIMEPIATMRDVTKPRLRKILILVQEVLQRLVMPRDRLPLTRSHHYYDSSLAL